MTTLLQANRQWSSRPADERFISLLDLHAHTTAVRDQSHATVVSTRKIQAAPTADNKGLVLSTPRGDDFAPSHFSFGQLAALAEAPAGYLRNLPSPIAADCVNWGLYKRDIEDVGLLLRENGEKVVSAATGPRYGRVWNNDITRQLIDRFGDGLTGDFRIPGEFGQAVPITKDNTTLYAGDRDLFVFLADEEHRIELPNRRDGKAGSLARGFFCWNSEVGARTLGIGTFFFDYVCKNRIVWGAEGYAEITLRHSAGAPDKFIEEITPAIQSYANSSSATITQAIENARAKRLDNVDGFLAQRFGKRTVESLKALHQAEENRPIETLWDVTTAVTAKARSVKYQDERVELERQGGEILTLAQ